MQYFIRQSKDSEIYGPYSVQQLAEDIGTNRILAQSYASSDLGETAAQLRKWRSFDWFKLSDIPELQNLFPPPPPLVPKAHRITLLSLIVQSGGIFCGTYLAAVTHHWSISLFLALSVWSLVRSIISYSKINAGEGLLAVRDGGGPNGP